MTLKYKRSLFNCLTIALPLLIIGILTLGAAEQGMVNPNPNAPNVTVLGETGWWPQVVRPVLIGLMSALGGAAMVGIRVSWWLSGWKTNMENKVEQNESRLNEGKKSISKVPRLIDRMEHMASRFEQSQEEIKRLDESYVQDGECDLTHTKVDNRIYSNSERLEDLDERLDKIEDKLDSLDR